MSSLHLVTGYAGKEHVTSADQGSFHAALFLRRNVVLNVGKKFAATIISNNSIKIQDGDILMQGRYIKLDSGTFVEVPIENGAQDYKRNDLIVVRYTKNASTGIESTAFVVIKGTPDTATAVDPAYTEADILDGALVCDMPLYRVPIDGLNVGALVPLFEVVDSFDERFDKKVDKVNGKGLSANDYTDTDKKQVATNKTDIGNIKDGTTKVGNAKKLDGHEAEYFASKPDLDARIAVIPEEEGGGVMVPILLGINSTADTIPILGFLSEEYVLGALTILDNTLIRISTDGDTVFMLDNTNFTKIVTPSAIGAASTADLANYLPKTGGRLTTNDNAVVLGLNRANSAGGWVLTEYLLNGVAQGRLGLYGVNNPVFVNDSGGAYTLHHDGNSAKVAIQSSAPTDTSALWVY